MKDLILRNETYIAQYRPRRIVRNRLVLRDERGRFRVVTRGPCQESQVLTLGARIKLAPKTYTQTFPHSIVQTGITRHTREYCRWQIFKATPFTHEERARLHVLFRRCPPRERIGFYILHNGHLYTEGKSPE